MTRYIEFPSVLDSSLLSTFKKCEQKAFREYFQHWKLRGEKVDLHAGKAFASGIEEGRRAFFERGLDARDAEAQALRALIAAYGDYQCPESSPKSLIRTAGALEYYYEQRPLDRDPAVPIVLANGVRGIEFSFLEPIDVGHPETGEPLLMAGRTDAICQLPEGVYGVDEKTTKYLGDQWAEQWKLRSQFTCYTWAGQRAKIEMKGMLVRGTQILKTKYDYREALTYRSAAEIDRWYNEMCAYAQRMIHAWERYNDGASANFLFNLDDGCSSYGGCPFIDVCKSANPEPWLVQSFERRRWDPVTRQETPLPNPRRVRVQVAIEFTVPGETPLENVQKQFRQNPVASFQDYCEGPFEVEAAEPPAPDPLQGIVALPLTPTPEGVGQVYSLLGQVFND